MGSLWGFATACSGHDQVSSRECAQKSQATPPYSWRCYKDGPVKRSDSCWGWVGAPSSTRPGADHLPPVHKAGVSSLLSLSFLTAFSHCSSSLSDAERDAKHGEHSQCQNAGRRRFQQRMLSMRVCKSDLEIFTVTAGCSVSVPCRNDSRRK